MFGRERVDLSGCGTSGGGLGNTCQDWPDPFCDYASTQMPRNFVDVLKWCEFLWLSNGTYRMACQRIIRFFITKLELSDISETEVKRYSEFLKESLKIYTTLSILGDDFLAYGNSMSSVYMPFRRFLICPRCHMQVPIEEADYEWRDWKFYGTCKVCRNRGRFPHIDRRDYDTTKVSVIRWSPHQIRMLHNRIGDQADYLWDIPADFKQRIKQGDKLHLSTTPWEVIEAVKDNVPFRFNDDVVYHMKEPALAGVRNNGWGVPRILSCFKDIWYVQVLKKYNEALALDFIIPWRVISPAGANGGNAGDPMMKMSGAGFRSQVERIVAQHRRDPAAVHVFPFPVNYQVFGGEAKQMAPHELMAQGTDDLLNAIGTPAELYRGTLQLQAAPTALRLFENTWAPLVASLNGWINWMLTVVSENMNWDKPKGALQKTTMAEDLAKREILLQLAGAGQISRATAYGPFGINYPEELRKMFQEERDYQQLQQRFSEEQQQSQELQSMMAQGSNPFLAQQQQMAAQMGMGAPGGAMPAGAGGMGVPAGGMGAPVSSAMGTTGGSGTTPDEMLVHAEQITQQLLAMPESMRRSELIKLKQNNEALHAFVKEKLQDARQEMSMQGRMMIEQQMRAAG